jgi:hypothetical protein
MHTHGCVYVCTRVCVYIYIYIYIERERERERKREREREKRESTPNICNMYNHWDDAEANTVNR